ncbi:hypothetical protein OEA41_003343 [Lepraria neglecta]|uniref:Survival protein SurE-like phosphatase/nucleotidase domain-containing protein n=1 Tax=Lepraria neglecta TaxID=209136 RepID=A0AAD9Z4D6_9LECA|nr:hypothetical protein OEA41_003343 [Lepraria neglecta]
MRFLSSYCLTVALALLPTASNALNIIVNNDDGFGSADIREFYRILKAARHNTWIVAPVDNQSRKGGTKVFTTEAKLTAPSEHDIVPAGAPSFETDPNDSYIWYYNGTPAVCTFFALDYVVPNYWNGTKVDLLVSGLNFGDNLGPFLYTLSGTIGATQVLYYPTTRHLPTDILLSYAALERGIPGIGFSGGNDAQRGYKEVNATTKSGYPDPATIDAQLSVDIVNQLAKNGNLEQLLTYGYGISVNCPEITSLTDSSCVNPPFFQTHMTGGADIDTAVLNETTGLFDYGTATAAQSRGANVCINGDCSLPGETVVVNGGCYSSVSVFTMDYNAPKCAGRANVRPLLQPLVQFQNSTTNSTASSKKRSLRRSSRARFGQA